jgi:hypothetical protein
MSSPAKLLNPLYEIANNGLLLASADHKTSVLAINWSRLSELAIQSNNGFELRGLYNKQTAIFATIPAGTFLAKGHLPKKFRLFLICSKNAFLFVACRLLILASLRTFLSIVIYDLMSNAWLWVQQPLVTQGRGDTANFCLLPLGSP